MASYIYERGDHCARRSIRFLGYFLLGHPGVVPASRLGETPGEIQIGGPACTFNADLIEKHTGIKPHIGPDWRFEEQKGRFRLLRTTRGCSGGIAGPCYACPVPRMDGSHLVELSYSLPHTTNCGIVDDNIALASEGHHESLVGQLQHYRAIDLNSGWEPFAFRSWHWDLWRSLPMVAWRTAFDELEEEEPAINLIRMWRAQGIPQSKIWVYVLCGGKETFEQGYYRAQKVLAEGGEPRIQMYKPNTWLHPRKEPYLQPEKGWTSDRIANLPRYFYSYRWRTETFEEYLERGA